MSLFKELKRRNVIRVGAAYVVVAWLLIQVAETIFPLFGLGDTPARIVVVVLAIGFVPALIFSWAFEYTPEGLKRDSDVSRNDTSEPRGTKKLDRVIMLMLALALGYLAFDKFVLDPERDAALVRQASEQTRTESVLEAEGELFVAVLPFANLGPDPENEYFGEAMTDELIGRLSRLERIRVVSRTSVARFRNTTMDVKDIAAELGVRYVLEGAVRKSGQRARVTAQLTDARSGFEEWADVFSGDSEDWFTLHEEMALQIAESLNLHLTPDEAEAIRGHLTNSSEAYDSFWKGWVLLESFHADISYPVEKISAAEAHFNRALNLDSDYSAAKAGLSLANSYYYFYGVDQTPARLAAAERLALESVENAPNLPQAHVALGMVRSVQSDHKAAVLSFRDALKLDSDDAIVWCMLAFSCNLQQPPDPIAAEEAAREAVRLDPTWMYSYQVLGLSLEMQGRYEEAVLAFESGKDLNPGYWNNYWGIGRVQLALGNHELAAEALQSALKLNESAEIHVYLGAAYAGLGEMEVALAAIEAGLEQGFDDFDAIKGSPYFASLRDDPRLEVLLKKYR